MYTVIRFTSISVGHEMHESIGRQLDILITGAYEGLRRAGDGFACEVSEADTWGEHRLAILNFIRVGRAAITRARRVGIGVSVDVAIEPEDLAGSTVFCMHVDPQLIRTLGEVDVGLEFTVYGGGPEDDGTTI